TGAIVGLLLLCGFSAWADAAELVEGVSSGDVHKGRMEVPMRWGAALAPETLNIALPGDCQRTIDMTMTWDEERGYVKVRLNGKGVLTPHPTVLRTAGVNFFPNAFWPEQKDIIGGRYQFWLISPAEEITLYYDGTTLNLLGSQYDFPVPPVGSIPVRAPGIKVIPSRFFQPNAHGDVDE